MANKILLADDSITIQKVVNLTFTDEGINVVTVGNGELALKKLGEEQFDLVLADIFMPGRNGYEVCEYVKANAETRDVPVILLVGAFEPFDKSEAARVQADGHLTKPFESRILIETVKRMLAESSIRRAQAAPVSNEPAYKGHVVGWDVPTSPMVPQHLDDAEPEPPPYDPYASTAKLPPLHRALGLDESAESPRADASAEVESSDKTMRFGAPLPTGALFTPGAAEPTSDMFEYRDPEPESEVPPIVRALEGPPDDVPGFSFNTGTERPSGPLADSDRPAIGYQDIPSTDSPLDLPELGIIEQHTHEPAVVAERRDPLLETFADVAESTARVDSEAAPGLEVNVHAEGDAVLNVGATEGIISAWDPQAQPPAAPVEPASDTESEQTQAFSAAAPPFGFTEEPVRDATAPLDVFPVHETTSPFEIAVEPASDAEREPAKPTLGLADLGRLETLRGGNQTERFTDADLDAVTSPEVDDASPSWEPVVEPVEDAVAAPDAEVVEIAESEPLAPYDVDTEPHAVVVDIPIEEAVEEDVSAEPEPEPVAAATDVVEAIVDTPPLPEEPVAEVEAAPVAEDTDSAIGEVASPLVEAETAPSEVEVEDFSEEAHAAVEVEEPVAEGVDEPSVVADPMEPVIPVNGSGSMHAGIPAELVEEVVRRTLERINDDVIREIAWEIVPELAEQLIRKRLSENQ